MDTPLLNITTTITTITTSTITINISTPPSRSRLIIFVQWSNKAWIATTFSSTGTINCDDHGPTPPTLCSGCGGQVGSGDIRRDAPAVEGGHSPLKPLQQQAHHCHHRCHHCQVHLHQPASLKHYHKCHREQEAGASRGGFKTPQLPLRHNLTARNSNKYPNVPTSSEKFKKSKKMKSTKSNQTE